MHIQEDPPQPTQEDQVHTQTKATPAIEVPESFGIVQGHAAAQAGNFVVTPRGTVFAMSRHMVSDERFAAFERSVLSKLELIESSLKRHQQV